MLKALRKMRLYALLIFIFGFLFSLFHQTMILEKNFIKVDCKINLSKRTDRHNLLSGWFVLPADELIYTTDKNANLLIDLPSTETYKFEFEIFVPSAVWKDKKDATFGIIFNDVLIEKPGLKKRGWGNFDFIAPKKIVKQGLNKIKLVNFPSGVTFKTLSISNFQAKRLFFLRTYMLWETVRTFGRMRFWKINLISCMGAGFILLLIWIGYSVFFRSFTVLSLPKVLSLDFYSYAFVIIILLVLYIIKLLSFYNPFYYELDFWLVLGGVILTAKIVQLVLFVNAEVVRGKIRSLKIFMVNFFDLRELLKEGYKRYNLERKTNENILHSFYLTFLVLRQILKKIATSYKFLAKFFIIAFIGLFFITWPLLYFNQKGLAEVFGNWAFLFLSMGLILQIIEYLIESKSSQNVN